VLRESRYCTTESDEDNAAVQTRRPKELHKKKAPQSHVVPIQKRRVLYSTGCSEFKNTNYGTLKRTCPRLRASGINCCFICEMLHRGLSVYLEELRNRDNAVTVTPLHGETRLLAEFETMGTSHSAKYPQRKFSSYTPLGNVRSLEILGYIELSSLKRTQTHVKAGEISPFHFLKSVGEPMVDSSNN
jgi:hypothetical protein